MGRGHGARITRAQSRGGSHEGSHVGLLTRAVTLVDITPICSRFRHVARHVFCHVLRHVTCHVFALTAREQKTHMLKIGVFRETNSRSGKRGVVRANFVRAVLPNSNVLTKSERETGRKNQLF